MMFALVFIKLPHAIVKEIYDHLFAFFILAYPQPYTSSLFTVLDIIQVLNSVLENNRQHGIKTKMVKINYI